MHPSCRVLGDSAYNGDLPIQQGRENTGENLFTNTGYFKFYYYKILILPSFLAFAKKPIYF